MYLSDDTLELKFSIDAPEEFLLEFDMLICSTSPPREFVRYELCLRLVNEGPSPIRFEHTVDKELVEPALPMRIDPFWRSSTGLSESFSRFNRKQSKDTIALDSSATIDSEPLNVKTTFLLFTKKVFIPAII